MTPERWEQIGEVYHAALEMEPGERDAFLDQACDGDAVLRQEVESLISAGEQARNFIAAPALPAVLEDAAKMITDEQSPTLIDRGQVGRYLIKSLLGSGGMGKVYLAQDTRLSRQVAIKLLPPEAANNRMAKKLLDRTRTGDRRAGISGSVETKLTNTGNIGVASPAISPDGKLVAYTVQDSQRTSSQSNIWLQPVEGGEPKQLTDFSSDLIFGYDWAPDGKRLACVRGIWERDLILIRNFR